MRADTVTHRTHLDPLCTYLPPGEWSLMNHQHTPPLHPSFHDLPVPAARKGQLFYYGLKGITGRYRQLRVPRYNTPHTPAYAYIVHTKRIIATLLNSIEISRLDTMEHYCGCSSLPSYLILSPWLECSWSKYLLSANSLLSAGSIALTRWLPYPHFPFH